MRKLKHPSICAYQGVSIAASRLSLVYEFLENGTLGDRLRGNHCLRRSAANGAPRIGANGCGNASGVSAFGAAAERSSFRTPLVLPPLGDADLLRIAEDVVGGMRYLHEVYRGSVVADPVLTVVIVLQRCIVVINSVGAACAREVKNRTLFQSLAIVRSIKFFGTSLLTFL